MMTKRRVKTDVGVKSKSLAIRSLSQVMQDDARNFFTDGSQRTIRGCSRKKK